MSDKMFDPLLAALEHELRADFDEALAGLLATTRTRLQDALAEVARECAQGFAEVAAQKADLRREIEAMQTHTERQQGRVELNVGGHHYQTSVQTLRHVPHTFFYTHFSGRYAQDVYLDGSIFVDRDGEHFAHVLEYMRDGVVSVAEAGARPSLSLLRALKREFGYCCIELVAEKPAAPVQLETAYVIGRCEDNNALSSMERLEVVSGQWTAVAAKGTACSHFNSCVIAGEIYITGGLHAEHTGGEQLASVKKYSPLSDSWSAVAPMPQARYRHVAVAVGPDMYVLGGRTQDAFDGGGVLKFDSTQGTWSDVEPAPRGIYASAAIVVGTDIYVFGGMGRDSGDEDFVSKYDIAAEVWSILGPMPHICSYHSASICNGLVYIIGVGNANGRGVLRFDPASNIWNTLAPTIDSRHGGKSFMLGSILYAAEDIFDHISVGRYDVATDTWMTVTATLEGRSLLGVIVIRSTGPAEEQDLFNSLIDKASRRQP
jgi:hypothetical protein